MTTGLLAERIRGSYANLSDEALSRVLDFYVLLLKGNEAQNLTRLTSEDDFFEGHWLDVVELLKSGFLAGPTLDLGSGCGVPGLLAAAVDPQHQWALVDSEKSKADFLAETAQTLKLTSVTSHSGRVEQVLPLLKIQTIVARAVGPVSRIYPWLRECSTWNTLVLLKGPGWSEEWAKFKHTKYRNELKIAATHDYLVGAEGKKRAIIQLQRVPRGTKA